MKLILIILGSWVVVSLLATLVWMRFMNVMGEPEDDSRIETQV
jgi:hypothetical protein